MTPDKKKMMNGREKNDQQLEEILRSLRPEAQKPDPARREELRRSLLTEVNTARADRARQTARRSPRQPRLAWRTLRTFGTAAAVVVIALGATTGIIQAADSAGPGDALYGVDRAAEKIRLRLAANPENAAKLRLSFAAERLDEISHALQDGNFEAAGTAESAYGEEISALENLIGELDESTQPTLADQVNAELTRHQERLTELLESENMPEAARKGLENALEASAHGIEMSSQHSNKPDKTPGPPEDVPGVGPGKNDEEPGDEGDGGASEEPVVETCANQNVADRLAAQFGVTASEIDGWFCKGYSNGDVSFAYETARQAGVSPEAVFNLLSQGMKRNDIRKQYGLNGNN